MSFNGALLIDKPAGLSSFGIIEELRRSLKLEMKPRDLPSLGHGGTLDPFATGLMLILVGRGAKLARYFLNSKKTYEGVIEFGSTTIPGDPTAPVSETSDRIPSSIEELRDLAHRLTLQPYSQTPPMHSAKKRNGQPLYKLARQGISVDREPKLCHLYSFAITKLEPPFASFSLECSSGTYVRTLAQDFGRLLGTVAMLKSLRRTASGSFRLAQALPLAKVTPLKWSGYPESNCWVPFDQLLQGFPAVRATSDQVKALDHGQQNVLQTLVSNRERPDSSESITAFGPDSVAVIYHEKAIRAVASKKDHIWKLDRVFPSQW